MYSIRDGRNVGYAATTVNRRIAAISGLFSCRQMRDGSATNPVPHGPAARRGHCQLEQSEGDFRRFASAIHQIACDV